MVTDRTGLTANCNRRVEYADIIGAIVVCRYVSICVCVCVCVCVCIL